MAGGTWKKKIKTPIGVYVATALVFIQFGLLDFLQIVIGVSRSEAEFSVVLVILLLLMSLFSMAASIWALTGQNEGRIAFIVMNVVNVLAPTLLAAKELVDGDGENDADAVMLLIKMTFVTLYVIGIVWYFLSSPVVAYYKQND